MSHGRTLGGNRRGNERFETTFSNVFVPSDAMSLRFPIFFALRRSRLTPVQRNRPRPSKVDPGRASIVLRLLCAMQFGMVRFSICFIY